jgi:hypothetical protein
VRVDNSHLGQRNNFSPATPPTITPSPGASGDLFRRCFLQCRLTCFGVSFTGICRTSPVAPTANINSYALSV